jgi:hypothetical protein
MKAAADGMKAAADGMKAAAAGMKAAAARHESGPPPGLLAFASARGCPAKVGRPIMRHHWKVIPR